MEVRLGIADMMGFVEDDEVELWRRVESEQPFALQSAFSTFSEDKI